MEIENLGIYLTLLTTLAGILPGLWALVKQYRKDVADSRESEATAASILSDSSAKIVVLYREWVDRQEKELAEFSKDICDLRDSVQDLTESLNQTQEDLRKTRDQLEEARLENAQLILQNKELVGKVQTLQDGVNQLIDQVRSLGKEPMWSENKPKTRKSN